jgi:N-acetylgalactosamine kinase
MDQSISFLAEMGQAKLIEFEPKLTASTVPIPPGVDFVVANSMVVANKAGANSEYNRRVVQCRLAAQVIAHVRGLQWQDKRRLCAIQNALQLSRKEMLSVVDEILHPEPYTREELIKILGVSDAELVEFSLKSKNDSTLDMTSFPLHARATHVFSEAERVHAFKHICDEGAQDATVRLGNLMNESHYSCSEHYDCSCSELDELTEICRESGALGSRLTGAGWGGCCVSMVPSEKVESFLLDISQRYYKAKGWPVSEQCLFPTKAGSGAHIIRM